MYILLDGDEVVLAEPADTKQFKISARPDADVDGALRRSGWGHLDSGEGGAEALIRVEAVRRAAVGRVSDAWPNEFSKMLSYARGSGWLSDDGQWIRAHLELADR